MVDFAVYFGAGALGTYLATLYIAYPMWRHYRRIQARKRKYTL